MTNSEAFDDGILALHPLIDFEYHDVRFTEDELDAVHFTCLYIEAISKHFTAVCAASFAAGNIPSWFRQDLSSEEISNILHRLLNYPAVAVNAFFKLDALTAIHERKLDEAAALEANEQGGAG